MCKCLNNVSAKQQDLIKVIWFLKKVLINIYSRYILQNRALVHQSLKIKIIKKKLTS